MRPSGEYHRRVHRMRAWLRLILDLGRWFRFFGYAAHRFAADGGPRQAAGLSYVSLLAIVPLFAIGLAVLAGFPAFESLRADLHEMMLENLLPDAGIEVSEQLGAFIDNASRMTLPGLIALGATALLLLLNVTAALNEIWRVAEPRPLVLRLAIYWVLLTLGPVLIGASLSLSGYIFAAAEWFGVDAQALGGGSPALARLLAFAFSALGFSLLFLLVPNRSVRPLHAMTGGVTAGLLFEGLKFGFGVYLHYVPSYQVVYGAIAAIPIFLIWMYLSWAVTLFGAEVAAALPEWRAAVARGSRIAGPGARLALALSLLARLRAAHRTGAKLRHRTLVMGLPATPGEIDETLQRLRRTGWIARGFGGRWILARDLDTVDLSSLAEALNLGLAPGEGWTPAARAALDDLLAAAAPVLKRDIDGLLHVSEVK
jgi:membrane protein